MRSSGVISLFVYLCS